MTEIKKNYLIPMAIIVAGLMVSAAVIYVNKTANSGGQENIGSIATENPKDDGSSLDNFAKCLTEKGAKFYGAWWCPHCTSQKEMFGDSFQYLNYIECEKNPGQSSGEVADACVKANIGGYPTWDFAGGKREIGELPLEKLSELSDCPLSR